MLKEEYVSYVSYVDEYSWKTFLGPQAKNITTENNLHYWNVKDKTQLLTSDFLKIENLDMLKSFHSFNFLYFTEQDVDVLKTIFKVKTKKTFNVLIPIEELKFVGRKYHGIRSAINKAKSYNLEICDILKNPEDIKQMLNVWSKTSGERYFQNRSGKNIHFFKNNFHENCINIFLYDQDMLVAFAVLSPPNSNGYCSYVVGKSLCLKYPGLSEYADVLIYEKAKNLGGKMVSLGGGGKTLKKYKMKFPGAIEVKNYDGTACNE